MPDSLSIRKIRCFLGFLPKRSLFKITWFSGNKLLRPVFWFFPHPGTVFWGGNSLFFAEVALMNYWIRITNLKGNFNDLAMIWHRFWTNCFFNTGSRTSSPNQSTKPKPQPNQIQIQIIQTNNHQTKNLQLNFRKSPRFPCKKTLQPQLTVSTISLCVEVNGQIKEILGGFFSKFCSPKTLIREGLESREWKAGSPVFGMPLTR